MAFDFRPYGFDGRATDGQLYNSENLQPEEFYNCTWEALRQTARGYGFSGFDDHQLRAKANELLSRGNYTAGERWETNVGVAQALWPKLGAAMAVDYPADVAAAIRAYGAKGFEVHCGFWCDASAWVPAKGPVTYSHAMRLLAADVAGTLWVNPEPHPDVYLTDTEVRDLYDGGGLLIFKIPVWGQREVDMKVVVGNGADARYGPGAVYLTNGIRKRRLQMTDPEVKDWLAACGQDAIQTVAQYTIDRVPEEETVDKAGSIVWSWKDLMGAIKATVSGGSGPPGPAGPPGPTGPPGPGASDAQVQAAVRTVLPPPTADTTNFLTKLLGLLGGK